MTELFKVRATGPLASHVEGFCATLVRLGYAPRTARDHGYVLVHLSRWLADERLEPSELASPVVERFLPARRRAGYRRWCSVRSVRPLLGYLREAARPRRSTQTHRLPRSAGLRLESPGTLTDLARCYKYWIALTGCDGFRIDTLKHVSFEEARSPATWGCIISVDGRDRRRRLRGGRLP
jgi:hypothetical protein